MLNSFIVTGASASGKSTLINEARKEYIYLPTHMTREPRKGERDGIDAIFINTKQFIENFNKNEYLEPSLEFALLKNLGQYYGTPKSWLDCLNKSGYCASPVSITIAKKIVSICPSTCWVHLWCSKEETYKRLLARGIDEDEINCRITSGDSIYIPDSANLVINTSEYSPQEILEKIKKMFNE